MQELTQPFTFALEPISDGSFDIWVQTDGLPNADFNDDDELANFVLELPLINPAFCKRQN
jgi:hypothetical protein